MTESLENPHQKVPEESSWTLFVDGSCMGTRSGAGVILTSPEGFKVQQSIRFGFTATNNIAEYEALIAGLKLARSLEVKNLVVYSDSQLVVKQVLGEYEARETHLQTYLQLARTMLTYFSKYQIVGVVRSDNTMADALSKLATTDQAELEGSVYLENLSQPSTMVELVMCLDSEDSWMSPIIKFLKEDRLPEDKSLARKVKYKSSKYCIINDQLYRKSHSSPLLRCLGPKESDYALREVHEGICGDHTGAKTLAHKILRQGYFWPSMLQDAKDFVQKCHKCQLFASVPHQPPEELSPILSPIPFAVWGIDILGPLPQGKGQVKFVVVAIDYFTKWVEAKPLARITERTCLQFFKEQVVYRFGIPMVLVSDNGLQFVGREFEGFLEELNIQHRRTSVAHPQANGQVEVTNRTLLNGIKRRLEGAKGSWPEELIHVLWAYRTTPRTTTGETPFKLAYGAEALIPIEIGIPSSRVQNFDEILNSEGLRQNLDLLEEERDTVVLRLATYQQRTARHFNKNVKARTFKTGDLVLRQAEASTPRDTGKLMPTWEGPYTVIEVVRTGTYKLQDMEGKLIPNTWHAVRLRRYYQ